MTETTIKQKGQFASPPAEAHIFNRSLVRQRRERAAANFSDHNFLVEEISNRLIDNLQDIRKTFDCVLNLNCTPQHISEYFNDSTIFNQDLSFGMLKQYQPPAIQADEELFPFKDQSVNLILSCLTLHWVNDFPGMLTQFLNGLKPDGLFLGALFGGETLKELRHAMMLADLECRGGASPHISPFIDVRDAGALLQRAGFALPVVSTERITVTYEDAFSLMRELKAMGENNALMKCYKGLTSPDLMMKVAAHYHEKYANDKGRIPVTFDILYLQGWAPHESQQKPLNPGSAGMALKDALGVMPPQS